MHTQTAAKTTLTERMIRNEDIFCSLLFDNTNRTLRVVDFRGGNFQIKHAYLERVLMADGMRKIFTLIERDDMNGWQRVGYQREGSIPGYYKRSDAYIMSRIYDEDYTPDATLGEESPENKALLTEVKAIGKTLSEQKLKGLRVEQITQNEVIGVINEEVERRIKKAKASKAKKKKPTPSPIPAELASRNVIFAQFSRQVEYHYFMIQNRRTKQANVIGAEYQDCFGNAKVDLYFEPETKAEQNLARGGLLGTIDKLADIGAVSIFSTVRADHITANAVYASCGFRNTGWMQRQLLSDKHTVDVILWTRKLI
ncbi:MAG: hypothetical protein QNJ97_24520 [Myxococcota bacterium]|nr:hypothetical protein [Myxococcota bacterium]